MADAAAERHGQETFFVVGEGIIGEALGGRVPTLAARPIAPNASAATPGNIAPSGDALVPSAGP